MRYRLIVSALLLVVLGAAWLLRDEAAPPAPAAPAAGTANFNF